MSKYKVGDKVKIREDLNFNCLGVIDSMLIYKGKKVTIKRIIPHKEYVEYHFEEIGFAWTTECIEGLVKDIKPVFKVGDKVKVREDLVVGNIYGGDSFTIDMADLRGKEVTIKEVEPKFNSYRIKETGYNWTDEMFERLAEEPKPKYVKCITSE